VPAHAMFAVSMGYNLSMAKAYNSPFYAGRSFLSPFFLHFAYDLILFLQLEAGLLIFVPYLIWMYVVSIRRISATSNIEPFDSGSPDYPDDDYM